MMCFLQVFLCDDKNAGISQWGKKKTLVCLGLWFSSCEQGTGQVGTESAGRSKRMLQVEGPGLVETTHDPQEAIYRFCEESPYLKLPVYNHTRPSSHPA